MEKISTNENLDRGVLIFVIEIDSLFALSENLRNLLFGNIDNFIVGDLSEPEKELFKKFTNNHSL